jgi:hypothetical protein
MPVEVYAIPDVNAWVATRGGVLGVAAGASWGSAFRFCIC